MSAVGAAENLPLRVAAELERRSTWLIVAVVLLTALLILPIVYMPPAGSASDNPGGPVYDLEAQVNRDLPPHVHSVFFLIEARDGGNVLEQKVLLEVLQNARALLRADEAGELTPPVLPSQSYLYNGFDADRQQPVLGIFTFADAVNEVLVQHPLLGVSLGEANSDQVKLAVSQVMSDPRTAAYQDVLSLKRESQRETVLGQEIDVWTAPAFFFTVVADNARLGGGGLRIGATSDSVTQGKEHFNRNVQAVLRGQEVTYQLWGVAIDAGLEIEDEVATAVPFIAATFLAVLVIVGISLRSLRVVALTAVGLIFMIIWLKGLSNLVGLQSSTTLDFIVPIAMISLGADFAIHAVHRYREEGRGGLAPRAAFRVGMAGVLTALSLAMLTDSIAFLANVTAQIETVVGFGIGAGLAILAAFIILGVTLPTVLMRLDAHRHRRAGRGEEADHVDESRLELSEPSTGHEHRSRLASLIVALARRRALVLPAALVVTAISAFYALQLEATFDVKDFFKGDSDFAVSLDKVDIHVGDSGGEPAIIYVQADLTNPSAMAAIQDFYIGLSSNPYVATNSDGEASFNARPVFSIIEQAIASDYARAEIEAASEVTISVTGDSLRTFTYLGREHRWPNSRDQLKAIFDYVAVHGVPISATQSIYTAAEVRETLFHDITGAREDATSIVVGIPGTRDQTKVVESRKTLTVAVQALESHPAITKAGLTGSPYTRQAGLDATTAALQQAFLIAVAACLIVTILAMRSIRYGVVTIIPITLVVAWLYGFMYTFGFGLNFITATIAAISIGVGIDYAVHMTQRYREEMRQGDSAIEALRRAAAGTGAALIASATTSVVGFAIMAFAPMPMFASYGLLTAVMIGLAAVASLFVLPSLLLLVTPAGKGYEPER